MQRSSKIQKVQVDTNNNLNSMWAVKLQQMQDGRLYIAGIGAGIENTPDGMAESGAAGSRQDCDD
ncbi:putative tail component of prophage [Escherichia coli]|nr:putative tail component of prophage [Escherichia coli]